ncbi:unnamed protein product [Closterium sp. Naga37s-1]|nr:unnamed protein product [Closterium sp. Naga37s-1]
MAFEYGVLHDGRMEEVVGKALAGWVLARKGVEYVWRAPPAGIRVDGRWYPVDKTPTPSSHPIIPPHPPTPSSHPIIPPHPPTPSSHPILPPHPPTPSSHPIIPPHPPTPSSHPIIPPHFLYQTKVRYLGALGHPNLVRLVGYCMEGGEANMCPSPSLLSAPCLSLPTHSLLQTEVRYLGALGHPNLVRLVGYCMEGGEVSVAPFSSPLPPAPFSFRPK